MRSLLPLLSIPTIALPKVQGFSAGLLPPALTSPSTSRSDPEAQFKRVLLVLHNHVQSIDF
jgi:hypothetical protein